MADITDSDALSLAEGITIAVGEAAPYGATLEDTGAQGPVPTDTGTLAEAPAIALDGPGDTGTLADSASSTASAPGAGVDSATLAEGVTLVYSDATPDGMALSETGALSDILPEDTVTLDDRDTLLEVDDFTADVTLAESVLITAPYSQTDAITLSESGMVVVSGNFSTSDSEGATLEEAAVVAALLVALDSATFAEDHAVAIDGAEVIALADPASVIAILSATETGTADDVGSVSQTGGVIVVALSASDAFTLDGESALVAGAYTGRARGTVYVVARTTGTGTATPRTVGAATVTPRAASTVAAEE